jgi:hypothetical protein
LHSENRIGGFIMKRFTLLVSVLAVFTWQLWATLGYRFGLFGDDNANVLVGYRALSQDYKKGNGENRFRWDVTIHGPVIGLAIDL